MLDWESLWSRTKKYIDIDDIDDEDIFKQRMISDFFKGNVPGKRKDLINELWDWAHDNDKFPKIVEIERREQEISTYRSLLPEEWRDSFDLMIKTGLPPKEAYEETMKSMEEAARKKKEAQKIAAEAEKKIKEVEEQEAVQKKAYEEAQKEREKRMRERQEAEEKRKAEEEAKIQRAKDRLNFVGEEL